METLQSILEGILSNDFDRDLDIQVAFTKLADILKHTRFKKAGIFDTRAGSYIHKGKGVDKRWADILKILNISSLSKYEVKKVSDDENCTAMYADVKSANQSIYIYSPRTECLISIEYTGRNKEPYLALSYTDSRYGKSALKTQITDKHTAYELPLTAYTILHDAVDTIRY